MILIDAAELKRQKTVFNNDFDKRMTEFKEGVGKKPRRMKFPQQQYAQTQQPVRIDGAGGVSTGTGMKAYLKESRIHLLSNVRGQYEAR